MRKAGILMLLTLCSVACFGQRITQNEVISTMVKDAWRFHNGASESSVFTKQNYTLDRRVLSADMELTRATYDVNKIKAYVYNPYPFVYTILEGFGGDVSIYYLPTNSIENLMRVIAQITGLKYDPDSPDSTPEEGIYSMESDRKEEKGSDGSIYTSYDYCRLIIHERFPANVGGCAVLVSFGRAID